MPTTLEMRESCGALVLSWVFSTIYGRFPWEAAVSHLEMLRIHLL